MLPFAVCVVHESILTKKTFVSYNMENGEGSLYMEIHVPDGTTIYCWGGNRMIDFIINLFSDIADFFVDLWINRVTGRKK